jgi:hypothetical protein
MNRDLAPRLSKSALHWCRVYNYPTDAHGLGRALRAADARAPRIVPEGDAMALRALVAEWLDSPELTEEDVDAVMDGYEG